MLEPQLATNSKFIEYYIRVGRSKKLGLHIITQGVEEIVKSVIGGIIMLNADTKILLDHSGKSEEAEIIREAFKFNSTRNGSVSILKRFG